MIEKQLGKIALRMAEKRVPDRFYEMSYRRFFIQSLVGITTYSLAFYSVYQNIPLELRLLSTAVTVVGAIADHQSTIKYFDSANRAEKKQIIPKNSARDEHIFIKDITTSEQFKASKRVKLTELAILASGFVFPGLGFPYAATKVHAALCNYRIAYRYDKAIEINEKLRNKSRSIQMLKEWLN